MQQFSELVPDNNKYLYYVLAFNASGESQPSDPIEVTVGQPKGKK
jgi:hypothetical protein